MPSSKPFLIWFTRPSGSLLFSLFRCDPKPISDTEIPVLPRVLWPDLPEMLSGEAVGDKGDPISAPGFNKVPVLRAAATICGKNSLRVMFFPASTVGCKSGVPTKFILIRLCG